MDFIDIDEIVMLADGLHCSKGMSCYESGFTNLCKVEDIGLQHSVVCRESRPYMQECAFAVPFGDRHFCKCPVRIHLVKKYRK